LAQGACSAMGFLKGGGVFNLCGKFRSGLTFEKWYQARHKVLAVQELVLRLDERKRVVMGVHAHTHAHTHTNIHIHT